MLQEGRNQLHTHNNERPLPVFLNRVCTVFSEAPPGSTCPAFLLRPQHAPAAGNP